MSTRLQLTVAGIPLELDGCRVVMTTRAGKRECMIVEGVEGIIEVTVAPGEAGPFELELQDARGARAVVARGLIGDGVKALEGNKEIASLISQAWGHEVSIFRVIRYASLETDPLPVWKVNGRAFADPRTVWQWAKRQPIYRRDP